MRTASVSKVRGRRRRIDRRKQLRRRVGLFVLVAALAAAAAVFWAIKGRVATPAMLLGKGYPEDLVELMERYPETKEFVLAYPNHRDRGGAIDLSGEVTKGKIPLFLQWDERWGYEQYGSSFLAVTGCGPTCLSMVYCGLTGNTEWNPYRMASMAEEKGYYVDGVGTAWALMEDGARDLGITPYTVTVSEEGLLYYLDLGMPVICSMGPGDFTSSGHFIVLKGVSGNGEIEVADPNSKRNSGKTWELETLVSQMSGAWAFGYDG